jgi:hypothetical protein
MTAAGLAAAIGALVLFVLFGSAWFAFEVATARRAGSGGIGAVSMNVPVVPAAGAAFVAGAWWQHRREKRRRAATRT